ncbi:MULTISPECIES: TetR/AcrR family transcriptional regulator [Actinokineospora]|uniref:TetR family transcriptional regulator n=1 Tax=Actinokineospora fastidiosa TaxID=1816 RepID=A0A918LDC5_9PSEU|nr:MULTISPECIES: TetR/AcrR family transcriptional regulator [Actinokineospora]UVS80021.1 transcriptional regulator BetI [Actinokineospora sp. UTMC 2448]GGS32541.1 TetR family transcriptional regulator [Actinokineospora fastidiosa]
METGGGLRERKKAATRQALHEAAVALTLAHGLDRVTVEAIADAAMVSRRTFSNYFGGKEQALLYDDRRRMAQLVTMVRERPAEDTPWQALTAAALDLCAEFSDPDRLAKMRALRKHPSLLSEQIALFTATEDDLADAISARMPDADPLRPRLMAAAFLTALRVASHLWEDEPDAAPLTDQVADVLAAMALPFD